LPLNNGENKKLSTLRSLEQHISSIVLPV